MSLLSAQRVSLTHTSHHTGSSTASKNHAHDAEELRTAVQEALTNFVTDTMYDKPANIYQYMAEWARKQEQEAKAKQRTSLSPTPPPRSLVMVRHAARGVPNEPVHRAETPKAEHPDSLDDTADRIMSLAQHRQQHFHDKAEGSRDHYLMALEDSDGDVFYVNALHKKMAASRKAELDAKADTAAAKEKLKEIEESEDSAAVKAQRKKELLHAYELMWESDLPKGHLN
jgi:hypothetical protein